MSLKTVAEQLAEQEKHKGGDKHKRSKSSDGTGFNAPLTLLSVALLILAIAMLPYFLTRPQGGSFFMPSTDNALRMTELAYQQGQVSYAMTSDAGQAYAATANAQAITQSTMQALQMGATQQAESTVWAMTQPALQATQLSQQLEIQQMQEEARLKNAILPIQVYFWPVFWIVFVIAILVLSVIAIALVLPGLGEKTLNWARVIKEERGERTIIHNPKGETTRPDLQSKPVLRHKENEPITTGGGFEDPQLQAGVVTGANYTKAVQGLPPGVRVPGNKPPEKSLPQIEILKNTDQRLLEDARKAVDEEEV